MYICLCAYIFSLLAKILITIKYVTKSKQNLNMLGQDKGKEAKNKKNGICVCVCVCVCRQKVLLC